MAIKYLVECYADELFLCSLLQISPKDVIHSYGRSRIIKLIDRTRDDSGNIYKALIDEDPHSIPDRRLNSYQVIKINEYIKIYDVRGSTIVVLRPDLEGFLLKAAEIAGINLNNYNIPNDSRRLHSKISTEHVKKNERFRDFINELVKCCPLIIKDIINAMQCNAR